MLRDRAGFTHTPQQLGQKQLFSLGGPHGKNQDILVQSHEVLERLPVVYGHCIHPWMGVVPKYRCDDQGQSSFQDWTERRLERNSCCIHKMTELTAERKQVSLAVHTPAHTSTLPRSHRQQTAQMAANSGTHPKILVPPELTSRVPWPPS